MTEKEFFDSTEKDIDYLTEAWKNQEKRKDRRFALIASLLYNQNVEAKDRKPFQHFMLHFPDPVPEKKLPSFEEYLKSRKRSKTDGNPKK